MGHIAHLRKQFKSINTYDYIITLIKRRKKNIIKLMRINWFFIWRNINPYDPRMLMPRFAEIGSVVLEKRIFFISSMNFPYYVIISPWKRAVPVISTNLNPLNPRMLCAKFG